MEEKLDFEINKIEINENDILNISFSENSTSEERYRVAKALKNKLKEKLGKDVIIFVTTDNYKMEKLSNEKLIEMRDMINQLLKEKNGNPMAL